MLPGRGHVDGLEGRPSWTEHGSSAHSLSPDLADLATFSSGSLFASFIKTPIIQKSIFLSHRSCSRLLSLKQPQIYTRLRRSAGDLGAQSWALVSEGAGHLVRRSPSRVGVGGLGS